MPGDPVRLEHYTSGSMTSVPIEVFMPSSTSPPCRAVLIVHGSSGLSAKYRPDIVSFAQALTAKGIAAMVPHYFVTTGMKAEDDGLPVLAGNAPAWVQACRDALTFMSRDARCDRARLGLLGFSFGAHVALRLGMDPPSGIAPKGVVDFFGPTVTVPLEGSWARMPPLQIHHGEDDGFVTPAESKHLIAKLEAAGKREGKDFSVTWYAKQGHGFDGSALPGARVATVNFFDQTL